MFGRTIAVEEALWGGFKEILEEEGCHVVKPGSQAKIDAIVLTGLDRNVMGMQDITSSSVVIDASGKTPEQILEDLQGLI